MSDLGIVLSVLVSGLVIETIAQIYLHSCIAELRSEIAREKEIRDALQRRHQYWRERLEQKQSGTVPDAGGD